MTMLSTKLKGAGYITHLVGKWHEGFFQKKFIPVNREFDTLFGFLSGAEDHMTQKRDCVDSVVNFWHNNAPDSHNGTYDAYM